MPGVRRCKAGNLLPLAGLLLAGAAAAQTFTYMVPVRDGTRLATDVYLPPTAGPWAAILTRTPYNKSSNVAAVDPDWIAEVLAHDYVYIVQDLRGRYASGGADSTFWTDGWGANRDGYDTVEWVANQWWCNGVVGTYGESARGIVQYLAAGALPAHLKACVAFIACDDFYQKAFFQGGAYRQQLVDGWFESVGAENMLPFFRAHPVRDAFWNAFDLRTRSALVQVPILHVGGHYDIFGESAIDAFTYLQAAGGPGAIGRQRLVLGPWTHYGLFQRAQGQLLYPQNAALNVHPLVWRWFDHYLRGADNGVDIEPPVDYYVMGDVDDSSSPGNTWVSATGFPGFDVTLRTYYLHGPNDAHPRTLRTDLPSSPTDAFWYVDDPNDPFPTVGGRNLDHVLAGPFDQRAAHDGRTDGVAVSTDPLTAPVAVAGKIKFRFWGACSVVDTDWCVKLIDVYPDGRQMLVTDGVLQARFRNGFGTETLMVPWDVYPFEVDLWSTAIVFDAGHRIMLTITNTNFPRFAINPQTGAHFGVPSVPTTGTIGVAASSTYPSHLLIPIVSFPWVGVADAFDGTRVHTPIEVHLAENPARSFRVSLRLPAGLGAAPSVYAVDGRLVGEPATTAGADGTFVLRWNGTGPRNEPLPPGVYFLHVRDKAGQSRTERLILRP